MVCVKNRKVFWLPFLRQTCLWFASRNSRRMMLFCCKFCVFARDLHLKQAAPRSARGCNRGAATDGCCKRKA